MIPASFDIKVGRYTSGSDRMKIMVIPSSVVRFTLFALTAAAAAGAATGSERVTTETSRLSGEASGLPEEIALLRAQVAEQQQQIQTLARALAEQKQLLERLARSVPDFAAHEPAPPGAASGAASGAVSLPTSYQVPARTMTDGRDQKIPQIDPLKGELETVAESVAQGNQRLEKVETEFAAHTKTAEGKFNQLGNFRFGGDLRVRYEPFFQEGAPDRHRERIRLRFNVTSKLTDEISGGFSLATGSLDDPISTNQSLTSFFNRKQFAVDKAWVTYRPRQLRFLKLDAGKFAYPWYRTGMTFDSDLNPEGFAQTMSFDLKNPVLRNITFVGFQLPINELSSGYDSFVLGGQFQSQLQLSPKLKLGLYAAGVNVNRSDAIALALASGELKPSLPNSNALRIEGGKVVGYLSKFAYLDVIARLDIDTGSRFPTTLQLDVVNNTRGPRERTGYWADLTVGKLRETRDLQFTYSFLRIEKEAIVSAFGESDIRSSTNVRNHRFQISYLTHSNLRASFTLWTGKLANPWENVLLVPPGLRGNCTAISTRPCRDGLLNRMQFDLNYGF